MTKDDPLDWKGKKRNWLTDERYSDQRNQWAATWSQYPLYADKPRLRALVEAFETAEVTILTSGTGSGKTVLAIPLMLKTIKSATSTVVATMPKRATVLSAAHRGAITLDVEMGKQVGYRYRESKESDRTTSARRGGDGRLIYATDGYVLAQSRSDPDLSDYDAVIIDEAHERGVPSDMLILAVLRAIQARRQKKPADPLRLVVMSATIDPGMFQAYFRRFGVSVATVHVSGESLYPVERIYLGSKPADPIGDGIALARSLIEKNARNSGKILLFVPTTRDTVHGCDLFRVACKKSAACKQTPCASLYGKQTQDQQMDALNKEGVEGDGPLIIATNVAESSLTIKDIKHVIDTGLQLSNVWLPLAHGTKLALTMASQAQIAQRVGRTGRTGPGTAYLMYTKAQHDAAPTYPPPAIVTSDVSDAVLSEMLAGRRTAAEAVEELMQLLTPPTKDQVKGALSMLQHYGLIDPASGRATAAGRACSRCMRLTRLDLWNALLIIKAGPDPELLREVLALCAVLEMVQQGVTLWSRTEDEQGLAASGRSAPSPALLKKHAGVSGDHEGLLRVLQQQAMAGEWEGLARGAWKKIVTRAKALTRPAVIERCVRILGGSSEPKDDEYDDMGTEGGGRGRGAAARKKPKNKRAVGPSRGRGSRSASRVEKMDQPDGFGNDRPKTLRSVVQAARSYHALGPSGRLVHVSLPASSGREKKVAVQSWFGGGKRKGRGCHYELLTVNQANSVRVALVT